MDDIDALRAEVAALRAELADQRTTPRRADRAMSRRRLLTGLAGLGAAGAAASVAGAAPAAAADGDNLVLGVDNDATTTTRLVGTDTDPTFEVWAGPGGVGLDARGETGLNASGASFGLRSNGRTGISARSEEFVALDALAQGPAMGFRTLSEHGAAIEATSSDGVPLVLTPRAGITGPPVTDPPAVPGSLFVDEGCSLWLCVVGGPDPTWTRLLREDTAAGRTVPITPLRAIDTRAPGGRPTGSPAIPGQTQGPLHGGTSLTLDLAGVTPIPTTATAVLGNLTIVKPTYNGYLSTHPSGTPATTSTLNFTTGAIVANSFTSALGPGGLTTTASGTTASRYHLVLDVTAYIT